MSLTTRAKTSLAIQQLGRNQPAEFAGADFYWPVETDGGHSAFGKANRGVGLADKRGGYLADVRRMAHPSDLRMRLGLLGGPAQKALQIAVGKKFLPVDNFRLARSNHRREFARFRGSESWDLWQ